MNPLDILLVRADASTQIGTGHIMRCLALAQAWKEAGGEVHFVTVELPANLDSRLQQEGMTRHTLKVVAGSDADAVQTAALARALGVTWVVEDGYHFGRSYQHVIKKADLRLLAIDDFGHAGAYVADLVLNQNIYAGPSIYVERSATTRLLLGTRYALLRREFWSWRGRRRDVPARARQVLVTMGGSDQDNVTLKVIRALTQVRVAGLEVVVVVGPGNPHGGLLRHAAKQSSHLISLQQSVTDMPKLMAWADVAVAGGGSTCWEMAFMGVPAVLLVLADNQVAVATGLNNAGCALNLGSHTALQATAIAEPLEKLLLASDQRRTMIERGQKLVDGNGAKRVLEYMGHRSVALRSILPDDCNQIWEWANDPITRAQSFSSHAIPWEKHKQWFEAQLADPAVHFYVAEDDRARPIGQVRFQIVDDTAIISVSLVPERRGQGYGAEVIRLGARQLFDSTQVTRIHAYIKPDNTPSIHAFTKAGFVDAGTIAVQECPALQFTLWRS